VSNWQVEKAGLSMLVVRRKGRGIAQDLARDDRDRIIWFTDKDEAQRKADELNGGEAGKQ
jgi:hypothetical protein